MVRYLMISYDSIACFYDVGFGARAVSRKTPIYFIILIDKVVNCNINLIRTTKYKNQ